jgi:DNA-binding NtrC family response regulator
MTGGSSQQLKRRFTPFPGTLRTPPLPSEGLRILAVGSQGDEAVDAALKEIERWSKAAGIEAHTASDLPEAVRKISSGRWDLVLIGLGERPMEELTWWADALRGAEAAPPVVAMIEWPSMSLVHEAERLGVRDVLSLPIRHDDFSRICSRLRAAVEEMALPLPPKEGDLTGRYALIGQHPSMLEIYKLIARVAKSSATVLIEGESGTGKECVAREIHASSVRATRSSAIFSIAPSCAR